jgi:hypothetical protein
MLLVKYPIIITYTYDDKTATDKYGNTYSVIPYSYNSEAVIFLLAAGYDYTKFELFRIIFYMIHILSNTLVSLGKSTK